MVSALDSTLFSAPTGISFSTDGPLGSNADFTGKKGRGKKPLLYTYIDKTHTNENEKVKSAYEPSGPSGRSLSRFL